MGGQPPIQHSVHRGARCATRCAIDCTRAPPNPLWRAREPAGTWAAPSLPMHTAIKRLTYLCLSLGLSSLTACFGGFVESEELPIESTLAVWAAASDDIWVAGPLRHPATGSGLVHYDGESWSLVQQFEGDFIELEGDGARGLWLMERERRGLPEARFRAYQRTATGFEEVGLPTEDGDQHYKLLGGGDGEVWLLSATTDDRSRVVEVGLWRRAEGAWVEIDRYAQELGREISLARDGEGRVWIEGSVNGRGSFLDRWSPATGWVSVELPPEPTFAPLQVHQGRVHYVGRRVYRFDEAGWAPITEEPDDSVRSSYGHTITPYGVWSVEHSGTNTSTRCDSIFTCGLVTTDRSSGIARLRRPGQEDFILAVDGSCRAGPCFVQEDPDEAWMIGDGRAWRLDVR